MTTNIKPSWNDAPDWARYLAQDGNGDWYWYSERPASSSTSTKVWIRTNNTTKQEAAREEPGGWSKTLERKP